MMTDWGHLRALNQGAVRVTMPWLGGEKVGGDGRKEKSAESTRTISYP